MRCKPKPVLIPTTSLSSYKALNCSFSDPGPLSAIDKKDWLFSCQVLMFFVSFVLLFNLKDIHYVGIIKKHSRVYYNIMYVTL
jgi:hypothetical protein